MVTNEEAARAFRDSLESTEAHSSIYEWHDTESALEPRFREKYCPDWVKQPVKPGLTGFNGVHVTIGT